VRDKMTYIERRIKRYWYTDGIGEIAGGAAFLLLGLYFATLEWFPSNALVRTLLDSSLVILMSGGGYAVSWLVNTLKTHLTYPRTGFVEYGSKRKGSWLGSLLTGAIAFGSAMLLVILASLTSPFNWLPGFTGLVLGSTLMILSARENGLGRFYMLGGFCILLGLALSFSKSSYSLGMLYGLIGVAAMISGGATLMRYLHKNPMPLENK
jgi:hypothetical protein